MSFPPSIHPTSLSFFLLSTKMLVLAGPSTFWVWTKTGQNLVLGWCTFKYLPCIIPSPYLSFHLVVTFTNWTRLYLVSVSTYSTFKPLLQFFLSSCRDQKTSTWRRSITRSVRYIIMALSASRFCIVIGKVDSSCPFEISHIIPARKCSLYGHKINLFLTKLVQWKWLGIGLILFLLIMTSILFNLVFFLKVKD